jgi:hypothetical protein
MIKCKNCLHPVFAIPEFDKQVWAHEELPRVAGGSKCPHSGCICEKPEPHPDDYKPVYLAP